MILSEFLQEISIKGWKLWNENGRLRYRAPNNEAMSAVLVTVAPPEVTVPIGLTTRLASKACVPEAAVVTGEDAIIVFA